MNSNKSVATARVKYHWFSEGQMATLSFDVDFFGDDSQKYKQMWKKICFKKLNQNESELKSLDEKLTAYNKERREILDNLSANKKWWKFWCTEEEKALKKKLIEVDECIHSTYEKRKSLCNKSYYNTDELLHKVECFLCRNGFILKSTVSISDEPKGYIDIWEKVR